MKNIAWRNEPPTLEEVTEWSWWWNSGGESGAPLVHQLDVDEGHIIEVGLGRDCTEFVPTDWPGEWAACVPPPAKKKKSHH